MPKLKFKAGNRVVPMTPAIMTVDDAPCRELRLLANQDNTADIVIGDSIYLDSGVAAVKSADTIALDTGDITVTAAQGGTPYDGVVISFETVAGTPVATPIAVATDTTIVITVNDTVNTTTANINTVVNALTLWGSAVANAGVFDPGDLGVTGTTSGGDSTPVIATLSQVLANGTLELESAVGGTAWNDSYLLLVDGGVGAAILASWDLPTKTLTLTYDSAAGVNYTTMATEVATNASDWVVAANAADFAAIDAGTYGPTASGVDAVVATLAEVLTNGTLTVNSVAGGTVWNDMQLILVDGGAGASTLASWDGATNVLTLIFDGAGAVSYTTMAAEVATNAPEWIISANAAAFAGADAVPLGPSVNGVNAVASNHTEVLANGTLVVTAADGGTGRNGANITLVDDAGAGPTLAEWDGVNEVLTLTFDGTAGITYTTMAAEVATNAPEWIISANAADFTAADPGTYGVTANGANAVEADIIEVLTNGTMTITSAVGGTDWNDAHLVLIDQGAGTSLLAEWDLPNKILTIIYDGTAGPSYTTIAAELVANASDWVMSANAALIAGADAVGLGPTTTGADAVVATLAQALTNGTMTITSAVGGTAWNDARLVLVDSGVGGAILSAWDGPNSTLTLTFDAAAGINYTTMATEVAANASDWVVSANAATLVVADTGTYGPTVNGLDGANAVNTVTFADAGAVIITAAAIGTAWNSKTITVAISEDVTVAVPVATYASNNILITVNATAATTTANIVTAIGLLADWTAAESVGGTCDPKDAGVKATTAGGVDENTVRGFILGPGEVITIETDSPKDIFCYCAIDLQVLSWIVNGA